ncbi:hypothetical protein HZB00_02030, partial [Candidatus Woesearchaeota archaeon]|nr:hypothetical protein [Candidatus Woesearchaeota archaeon]
MQFQVQNGIKEATVILEGETEKFSINYQEAVQNILNKIKKTYGAFPGLETPAGILKINVNEGKKEEILLRDTEEVKIAIDLAPLKDIKTEKIQDYFEYLLSYELYRGLAQFNHQEQEIRQEIK